MLIPPCLCHHPPPPLILVLASLYGSETTAATAAGSGCRPQPPHHMGPYVLHLNESKGSSVTSLLLFPTGLRIYGPPLLTSFVVTGLTRKSSAPLLMHSLTASRC